MKSDKVVHIIKKPLKRFGTIFGVGFFWAIKVTIFTFFVCIISSMLANLAAAKSNFVIAVILLLFMIFVSIFFDALGVSVTSCNYNRLIDKLKCGDKKDCDIVVWLSKNAEKVNNVCCDVVGDMCGILSGACGVNIVVNLCKGDLNSYLISVVVSSLIASITVGGKAITKGVALSHSQKFVVLLKNLLKLFWRNNNSKQKKLRK